VLERDTGIAAEQRPTVQGVRLTTRGERAVVDGIRFLIDTGARVSVISTAVAERLELRTEFPASFRDIIGLIGVANGCKTHWLTMTVPQLGEPSFSLPHLFVVYGDQCILGMDALHFFELRMRGQEPVTLRPLTD
jgi:predicted aspartyl protease